MLSDSCQSHLAQGVRFNAEKVPVGSYYTTPIWLFRCKCAMCQAWFEIRTDPKVRLRTLMKNTDYVVVSGARKQVREWEPSEDDLVIGKSEKTTSGKDGAFADIERQNIVKNNASSYQDRIAELEQVSAVQWSDPYMVNAQLRKAFRAEKHARIERELRDANLRERIGWSQDRILEPVSSTEPGYTTPDIRRAWSEAQDAREKPPQAHRKDHSLRSAKHLAPAARKLAGRLIANTHSKQAARRRQGF